jgi:hypothetical protein
MVQSHQNMERVMGAMALGGPFRRLVVVAGATIAAMVALLLVKPIYSFATYETVAVSVDATPRVADQRREVETASFVTSPTIDNQQLFYGTGDGSNGYYGEGPKLP